MGEIVDIVDISNTIIHMIDEHILVCDLEGYILFANATMQSYLGYDDLQLKQKKLLDLIEDSYKNKARSFIENLSEDPSNCEEFIFNSNNNMIKLHIKFFKKNNYIYIYGNEKYIEYDIMKKKLDGEIAKAIKIHKRSLPEELPNSGCISFASLYIPAEKLGGDLFDVFKVDHGLLNDYFEQYICFVADVSGHGLDSAMLAVFIKDTIRSYFRLKHIPGQVVSPKEIMNFVLEQYTLEGYPDEYLVCIFLTVIDLKINELTYCNSGFHKSPLLISDEINVIELNNGTFPISAAIDLSLYRFKDCSHQLSSTMTLFLMSDGLPEQKSNDEYYEDRLKRLVTEVHNLNAENIILKIQNDFNDFLKTDKAKDDITLVVAKLS